jgi:hypothetical protein
MYLPRSYIACLMLLSKSFGRDSGRTYCNKKNELLFVSTKVDKNKTSLMLREHLINLVEAVTEKGSLRIGINSLVISWLGTGVARALRMNSSEPMVGWKGEHPQLVSWLQPVIDKYSHIPCN